MKLSAILLATIFVGTTLNTQAVESLDRVAIIVNNGIVLQSEIGNLVSSVKRRSLEAKQALPSDRVLRTQATERLIDKVLKEQMAERMGMRIGDAQLDQTIEGIAREQKMTINQLKDVIEQAGDNFANYRESIRSELLLSQVERISVRRRVNISEQEIDNLVTIMQEHGKTNTEYHIGHILISTDSSPEAQKLSRTRADKVLAMLKKGDDFKRIAITSSSGPKALEGGDWGFMNINEMPTLFTDAVKGHKAGDIIGPIKSGNGFHILTVFEIKGKQQVEVNEVNSRHILIKPSIILSDERAKEMLNDFVKQIKAGTTTFSDLAKEHSADPGSAVKGGELGWSDPSIYVPAFKNVLAKLEKDEISAPFLSSHGWHIIQFIGRRNVDATDKFVKNRAYQLLFNRKFSEESAAWSRELRSQAYIEIVSTDD
ncbi:MAG: peptidylprolyl isomerase SurA [Gammaproteobacteria bacterium]|nr:peptidylprolyl isomerase SurA [Gammaproteobacteria bacterium]